MPALYQMMLSAEAVLYSRKKSVWNTLFLIELDQHNNIFLSFTQINLFDSFIFTERKERY